MGSTTSALASTASTFEPVTFTGVSSYSTDLQSVYGRAVAIAQLPVKSMQNDQADIASKVSALQTMNPYIASLGADLQALGKLGAGQALSASSSNSALVSARATGATSSASYTISNISSVASMASAVSANFYSDATTIKVSSAGTLKLVVGTQSYDLTLSSAQNNLNGLVSAINKIPGGPFTASVLTTKDGDYLSLSAADTGQVTALQLNDIPASPGVATNLLATSGSGLNLGANAVFLLNGATINQPSNTINNVVGGLTLTILGKTTDAQTVNVAIAPDPNILANALQTFVSDYNGLRTQVNGNVGKSGGALTGNSLVYQIESSMQQVLTYEGSGSIQSLADLGITLDNTGVMSFDSTAVTAMTPSRLSSAVSFMGTSTGFGALASNFTQISDPISGMIKTMEDSFNLQDQNIQSRVDAANLRINTMQINLQSKLEKADASLAALATQQQILTSSIQAINLTTYGMNPATTA